MMSPLNSKSESGYTLQTLIIIAILVLATTTASVLLYAVLRDSTSRIAGGSETFDGLPGGPQNLRVVSRVVSEPSGSNLEVTISWEAPSYLGEFPPTGYDLSINEDGADMDDLLPPRTPPTWNCGPLNTSDENFTYDNQCKVSIPLNEISNTSNYELVFTIKLGSASGGTSPGGLTFYRELSLSADTSPPTDTQARPLPDAVELSWEAEPDVVYRLHIELSGTDYYQCFATSGGTVTREVPNIKNRSGTQNNITLTRNEMPPPSTGRPKYEYTIKLSASTPPVPSTLDNSYCMTDSNFGKSVDIAAIFGTPPIPEITLETESTRTVGSGSGEVTLATLKATLSSCEEDMDTTFFWEETGKPETQSSQTIAGCESPPPPSPPCTSDCELIVRGDFVVGTEYEFWAVASNDVGNSSPSMRQRWVASRVNSPGPGRPQNVNVVSSINGLIISWDSPELIPEGGISGYYLRRWSKDAMPTCQEEPPVSANEQKFSVATQQYIFLSQANRNLHCFQLSSYSIEGIESPPVKFEAAYRRLLTIETEKLNLIWKPEPGVRYYTISWAPLAEDTECDVTTGLDIPSLQPPQFLTKTFQADSESSLFHTIPVIRNNYYLLEFTTSLTDGSTFSWSGYVCAGKNAPPVSTPAWTGTTTAGGAVGLEWTKPELNAYNYDNLNYDNSDSYFSYALRITDPGGTTTDQCIAFGDSTVPETTTNGVTTVSYAVTSTSVAGNYEFSLTVAPTSACGSNAEATSIIDTSSADTPPVRTGTITIM